MRDWIDKVKKLPLQEQWRQLYFNNRKSGRDVIWTGGPFINQGKLPELFRKYDIKKFTDCGCADFTWLSQVDWTGIDYTGVDIVPELITQNRERYPHLKFRVCNLVEQVPPRGDMIYMRDVLCHLSLSDCIEVIKNIKRSKSTYLMVSTYNGIERNDDTSCIIMRLRNLMIPPFDFPDPIEIFEDKKRDKNFMGLWLVKNL